MQISVVASVCSGRLFEAAALLKVLFREKGVRQMTKKPSYEDLEERLRELERAVSERKQAVEALQASDERYRSLIEQMDDGVLLVDPNTQILDTNNAMVRILGYSREELCGRSLYELADHHPNEIESKTKDGLEMAVVGPFEARYKSKDGRIVHVEVRISRIQCRRRQLLLGVIRDITGRKEAEIASHASLEKYEKTFQAAPVWVVLSTLEDGRYIEVNKAFLKTTGYKREEVIGKTSLDLETWVDPEDRERIVAQVREKGSVRNAEVRRKTRSGKIIYTLFSAEALQLGDEQVMVSMTEDITEWRQAEEEKARLETQFRQVQKLESIGRLTGGGAAHDLNNLLSPILGYGEMLLEDASEKDPSREPLEQIVRAGRREKELVHQLLAFGRKQALEFTSIDLNSLLKNFQKLLRRTIREDISIHLALAESLPLIKGDEGQLEQVLLNLAINAQDAMPEGGIISIKTQEVDLDDTHVLMHRT